MYYLCIQGTQLFNELAYSTVAAQPRQCLGYAGMIFYYHVMISNKRTNYICQALTVKCINCGNAAELAEYRKPFFDLTQHCDCQEL